MKIIVVGLGEAGRSLIKLLDGSDHDITVIDKDRACVDMITDKYTVNGVCGSGASIETLTKAGADMADVLAFFAMFKRRLQRYLAEKEQRTDLSSFTCEKPIPIATLESLRNQICYTNRNNFVVDPGQTPFSYPYGANAYYFMPAVQKWKDACFGDLTLREKRRLVHAREVGYPESFVVTNGYFSPMSFCRLDIGEGVFRDARHVHGQVEDIVTASSIPTTN